MADTTEQELRDTLATLTEKIAILETRIAALEARQEIPESDLIAIGAAVAAYFGLKAKVRAVRFGSQTR